MMQYLKSVTSIYPGTVIKMYATDKKFNFVPLCNLRIVDNYQHLSQVLMIVGQNCPKLKELNVSCCPISDKALTRLFWDPR